MMRIVIDGSMVRGDIEKAVPGLGLLLVTVTVSMSDSWC